MDTRADYQSYINSMKNLQISNGRKNYQEPFAGEFEKIFAKAQDAEISLNNAIEFLQNLSKSEVESLQKYAGLADEINTENLSAEGSYNLLMHDNEKYDFDNDGIAETGIAKSLLTVPTNMTTDTRDAYIEAMNSLNGKDRLMATILTFNSSHINSMINGTDYEPPIIDYNYLKERVEDILNPTGGAFTSEETKTSIRNFWQTFNTAYEGDRISTNETENIAVKNFLKELREKGAAGFLANLDMEKIEEKVKEFRDKLIEQMGDSPEAMATIEKMVSDYRKQLLEQLKNSLDKDEKPISIDSQVSIKTLLNLRTEEKSPLTELLSS